MKGRKINPLNAEFGKKLFEIRKKSGITQEELSRRIGVVRATIANLEAGRQNISLRILYRIALTLKCDLNSLLPPLNPNVTGPDIKEGPGMELEGWTERVIRKSPEN